MPSSFILGEVFEYHRDVQRLSALLLCRTFFASEPLKGCGIGYSHVVSSFCSIFDLNWILSSLPFTSQSYSRGVWYSSINLRDALGQNPNVQGIRSSYIRNLLIVHWQIDAPPPPYAQRMASYSMGRGEGPSLRPCQSGICKGRACCCVPPSWLPLQASAGSLKQATRP
jgi:hypothetical protein